MQRWQSHSGFRVRVFGLKDSNDEVILIVSGTLLQILGAVYETVSVPYLKMLFAFQNKDNIEIIGF